MFKRVIVVILVICVLCAMNYYEHNYTRQDCEIVSVANGIVRFEDRCEQFWDWEIAPGEHFEVGDRVDLKMHDNFTSGYICDDEITKVVFCD